jgi:hypothetical protein
LSSIYTEKSKVGDNSELNDNNLKELQMNNNSGYYSEKFKKQLNEKKEKNLNPKYLVKSEISSKKKKQQKKKLNEEISNFKRNATPSKAIKRFNKKVEKQCKKMKLDYSEYYNEMKEREYKRSVSRSNSSKKNMVPYSNHLKLRLKFPTNSNQEYNNVYTNPKSSSNSVSSNKKIQFQGFLKPRKLSQNNPRSYKSRSSKKHRTTLGESVSKDKNIKNHSMVKEVKQKRRRTRSRTGQYSYHYARTLSQHK